MAFKIYFHISFYDNTNISDFIMFRYIYIYIYISFTYCIEFLNKNLQSYTCAAQWLVG